MKTVKATKALVYLDDIISHAYSFDDYLNNLENVFTLMEQAELNIPPKKCSFVTRQTKFLDHPVAEVIKFEPKLITVITNFVSPKLASDLKSFLGLAGYYRKFIFQFAHLMFSLNRVTQKGVDFRNAWSEIQHQAFFAVKTALSTTPVLARFEPAVAIMVETEARGHGVTDTSSQGGKIVTCASRSLNPHRKITLLRN